MATFAQHIYNVVARLLLLDLIFVYCELHFACWIRNYKRRTIKKIHFFPYNVTLQIKLTDKLGQAYFRARKQYRLTLTLTRDTTLSQN